MPQPTDRSPLEDVPGEPTRLNIRTLDEDEIENIRQPLFDWAASRQGQDVRLDLSTVDYLTSTGLALFLTLHNSVRQSGGRLSLHNVHERVHELFTLTRLTGVLDIRCPSPG
jgi:anti-anti-sigma factor